VEFIAELLSRVIYKMNSLLPSPALMKNDLTPVIEHISQINKQVLRLQRSKKEVRVGWREYAQGIEKDGADDLLPYEFLKIHDKDWVWWVTKLTVSF